MKFNIPFTFGNLTRQRKKAEFLKKIFKHKKDSKIQLYLLNSDTGLLREEYLAICLKSFIFYFIFLFLITSTALIMTGARFGLLFAFGLSLIISFFIFLSQLSYPRIYNLRKQREIEKNLIPALEDMLIQLNSGIPLFTILVNISSADYGSLSDEFKKIVKKINAGLPQMEVLEEMSERSPSIYLRRTFWQISNGMRAGSDLAVVIKESIKSLNEEQYIQIQNYGNKLNPLIMFYMLISVIMPALAITFLTIISSLVNISGPLLNLLFLMLFGIVIFIQIMFLGIIKSVRPSLL